MGTRSDGRIRFWRGTNTVIYDCFQQTLQCSGSSSWYMSSSFSHSGRGWRHVGQVLCWMEGKTKHPPSLSMEECSRDDRDAYKEGTPQYRPSLCLNHKQNTLARPLGFISLSNRVRNSAAVGWRRTMLSMKSRDVGGGPYYGWIRNRWDTWLGSFCIRILRRSDILPLK